MTGIFGIGRTERRGGVADGRHADIADIGLQAEIRAVRRTAFAYWSRRRSTSFCIWRQPVRNAALPR